MLRLPRNEYSGQLSWAAQTAGGTPSCGCRALRSQRRFALSHPANTPPGKDSCRLAQDYENAEQPGLPHPWTRPLVLSPRRLPQYASSNPLTTVRPDKRSMRATQATIRFPHHVRRRRVFAPPHSSSHPWSRSSTSSTRPRGVEGQSRRTGAIDGVSSVTANPTVRCRLPIPRS